MNKGIFSACIAALMLLSGCENRQPINNHIFTLEDGSRMTLLDLNLIKGSGDGSDRLMIRCTPLSFINGYESKLKLSNQILASLEPATIRLNLNCVDIYMYDKPAVRSGDLFSYKRTNKSIVWESSYSRFNSTSVDIN